MPNNICNTPIIIENFILNEFVNETEWCECNQK